MNWFKNKKKKKGKPSYSELEQQIRDQKKMNVLFGTRMRGLEVQVSTLEKESVHWKEKAMNFKKFHQ